MKTPAAAGHGNDGQPVNEHAENSMLQTPINSGVVDHGESDPTTSWLYCDAGNPYKPGYPCAVCGATGDQPCNAGQYVSPALRKQLRTETQARADLNCTPLERHHKQSARTAYAAARILNNLSADCAAKGDRVNADHYAALAEAVSYCAAVTEAN